jgi:uridine monophosphate synthetase
LAPGIGSQKGNTEKIISATGKHTIFPISRAIAQHTNFKNEREAAQYYKKTIEKIYVKNSIKQKRQLLKNLHTYKMIKFGNFTLKSGITSSVYIDLRSIISYPHILSKVVDEYINIIQEKNITFDKIAGIAYGALGIAFQIADKLNKPTLLIKKEGNKNYGIQNQGFIGHYTMGEKILIIEDVATTGNSAICVAKQLKKAGLQVTDAIVLLDRESGAKENFVKRNITMHSIVTMNDLNTHIFQQNANLHIKLISEHGYQFTNKTL